MPVSTESGVGLGELLHLFAAAFPPPTVRPLPTAMTPAGRRAAAAAVRPGRAAGRRGGAHDQRRVRRAGQPRARVQRHDAARHGRCTCPATSRGFAGHEVEGHGDHDEDERIGLLSSPSATTLRPKPEALAGDLCVVAKLSRAETTDTLSSKDSPAVVEPWVLPDPLLPVAIHAVTKSDEDKLAGALQRLVAEDPTMRLEHNAETHQVVLWTMGQAHVDVLLERLRERYAVTVEPEPLRVPLREAFVAPRHRPRPPRQAERRPRPVRRVRHHRGAPAARRGL